MIRVGEGYVLGGSWREGVSARKWNSSRIYCGVCTVQCDRKLKN